MTKGQLLLIIYIAYLLFFTIITFFLFIKDKSMAKKNGDANRIKEKTLLGFSAIGGGIGAFFGRIIAHHKTDKVYFSIIILLSAICELAVLALFIYFAFM